MAVPLIYSLRSIAVRKGSSAMAVGGIALVVIVFVTLLALAEGFRNAVASSGSPNNIMVLRKGSDAELQSQVSREVARIIKQLPCVAENAAGEKIFAAECVVILARKRRDGGESNITVRGAALNARDVHNDVHLTKGRWLTPGTEEAVIGSSLARRLEGFSVGDTVTIGRYNWRIVGEFEAGGSALESELWMDVNAFMSNFRRGDIYQSLLFRAAGDPLKVKEDLTELIAKKDPRLRSVEVDTEKQYYEDQSKLMSSLILVLSGLLTTIMSVGAIVGAMNTMYAAVSQRQREIGCLLSMGFTPGAIFLAFMVEALALASLGAAIGCGISMLFDGLKTGTTNWATFSETGFEFRITAMILAEASVLALLMGFIGGVLPALRAARMKVVDALRRA
jgi:putative ABC transport system permease protein